MLLCIIHMIVRFTLAALALLLVAEVVPGIEVDSIYIALLAAFVLGVLHVLVKPILFILTLPITIITFGLFSFVLNAFMFWLTAHILDGFAVSGFLPALVGSVIMTAVSTITHRVLS